MRYQWRWWALALALMGDAALAAATPASDAAADALRAKVEACLTSGAAEAARYSAGLTDAVSFLTDDLCAVEVTRYHRYKNNVRILASWRSSHGVRLMGAGAGMVEGGATDEATQKRQMEAMKTLRLDPDTGEIVIPDGVDLPTMFEVSRLEVSDYLTPTEVRAAAARAVLEARRTSPR